MGKPRKGAEYI